MEQLVGALEEDEFALGECIVREGEVGHAFYILQSGEISVHQKDAAAQGAAAAIDGHEADVDDGIGPQVIVLK